MHLCTIANRTYAAFSINIGRILSLKGGNEIVGIVGKVFDDLLVTKKHLRLCKLIGEENLGEKLPNGTYTGNLGLIQSRKALVYLKSEAPILQEDFIAYGLPFYLERFRIIEAIRPDQNNKKINNMMNNFNFDYSFVCAFVIAIFISYLFSIFLQTLSFDESPKFVDQLKKSFKQNSVNFLGSQWMKSFSALAIFLLLYDLHLWFVRLSVSNNIKTNKVIVDSSLLIKSVDDAFRSKKICCFLDGSTEIQIALSQSKDNVLKKLYEEKGLMKYPIVGLKNRIRRERCVIEKTLDNMDLDPNALFAPMAESTVYALASALAGLKQNFKIWFHEKAIFETNFHIISRNEKEVLENSNKIVGDYIESGIPLRLMYKLKTNAYKMLFQMNTLYTTVEEFAADHNNFDILTLDNFQQLFQLYFAFFLSLTAVFAVLFLLSCVRFRRKFHTENTFTY